MSEPAAHSLMSFASALRIQPFFVARLSALPARIQRCELGRVERRRSAEEQAEDRPRLRAGERRDRDVDPRRADTAQGVAVLVGIDGERWPGAEHAVADDGTRTARDRLREIPGVGRAGGRPLRGFLE